LLHKPTKMEAESQPLVPEPQIPPRISFSPLMQNCTPSKIASPYLDWVNSAVSRTHFKSPLEALSASRLQPQPTLR
jgi:hypothetical protein